MLSIHQYISQANHALLGAANAVKTEVVQGSKIKEPDYTLSIVTKFPKLMNDMWGNVRYGGCFIHQKPYVTMSGGACCEVGDLLVLCRQNVGPDVNPRYNAALFQLKRDDHYSSMISPDNKDQLQLYLEWPLFSFGRKYDAGKAYNIEPKTVTSGAQYMFVNDGPRSPWHYCFNYCGNYPVLYTHSIPGDLMHNNCELSFGLFLWYFIHWQTGRPFAPEEEASTDQWSKLIWDILVNTQNAVIRNANTDIQKKHNIGRNNGDFFSFLMSNDCMGIIPPSYYDYRKETEKGGIYKFDDNFDEENNGEISILFIDVEGVL